MLPTPKPGRSDFLPSAATTSPLRRNPHCPCEHLGWRRVTGREELVDASPGELLAAAGSGTDGGAGGDNGHGRRACSVSVAGHVFAERAACGCARDRDLRRFIVDDPTAPDDAGRCPRCGERLRVGPFFRHAEVPVEMLEEHLERPLRDLGVTSTSSVLVRAAGGVVQFRPHMAATVADAALEGESHDHEQHEHVNVDHEPPGAG